MVEPLQISRPKQALDRSVVSLLGRAHQIRVIELIADHVYPECARLWMFASVLPSCLDGVSGICAAKHPFFLPAHSQLYFAMVSMRVSTGGLSERFVRQVPSGVLNLRASGLPTVVNHQHEHAFWLSSSIHHRKWPIVP